MSDYNQSPVKEGDLLAGKYRVERVLGQGGMGVVVAAQHVALNQRVAVKFLLESSLGSAESIARFVREARSAVQIQSEHVARVIDVGTLENGAPYMVMEYLQGQDLSQVLRDRGPLPIEETADYVLQACEAIAEAHALGIVHRDLKPANLFLSKRADGTGIVKVLDFGISKALGTDTGATSGAMTGTGMIFGSPLYMSPEQMKSAKDVDQRTDIWALGVIIFELLTGRELFVADTMPGIVARIVAEPPEPLRSVRPEAPEELELLLFRCLEKNREKRVRDVAELARGLQQFAPPHMKTSVERIVRVVHGVNAAAILATPPPTMMAVAAPAAVAPPAAAATNANWGTTNNGAAAVPTQKSKAPIIAAVAVLAVALIAGAAVFATRGGAPTKDTASAAAQPEKAEATTATPKAEPAKTEPAKTAEAKPEPAKTAEAKPEPVKPTTALAAVKPAAATTTTTKAAAAVKPTASAKPTTAAVAPAAPAKPAAGTVDVLLDRK